MHKAQENTSHMTSPSQSNSIRFPLKRPLTGQPTALQEINDLLATLLDYPTMKATKLNTREHTQQLNTPHLKTLVFLHQEREVSSSTMYHHAPASEQELNCNRHMKVLWPVHCIDIQ